MKSSGFLPLLCAFCSAAAWAQSESPIKIAPDSPDFTVGTSIVPLGHFQTESRVTAQRRGPMHEYGFGETLVRYGVSQRAEVRVGIPSYLSSREGERTTGLDDASVEVKIKLYEGPKSEFGFFADSLLPTGSHRVAEQRYQPSFRLTSNFKLSSKLELLANLGARRASSQQERFTKFIGATSLRYDVTPQTKLYSELYGFNRLEVGGRSQRFAAAGVIHLLGHKTALDARVGSGLGNRIGGPDYFYELGFSRLF